MNRRSFLMATAAIALGQGLGSCGARGGATFRVRLLRNSIPAQLFTRFRQTVQQTGSNFNLDFAPVPQIQDLFTLLQTLQRQAEAGTPASPASWDWFRGNRVRPTPDLVTLGDYWLDKAIQQQLIQPLDPARLQAWQNLPSQWQDLVRRDRQGQLTPQGEVWGAPYRWGTTVIAYRTDRFRDLGWTPTDWSDLWRPELQGRISLLNQPREVIGLTLKRLGYSYNTADLAGIPNLPAELRSLHQQARLYSSDAYLQPLLLGDTWAAVGWSTDILPLMQRAQGASLSGNGQIAAIVPQSGTALWADLWVRPATAASPTTEGSAAPVAERWIDFCWEPQIASQLSVLTQAASPVVVNLERSALPNALQRNPLLLPEPQILERSEFLQPLPETAIAQYQTLWQEVRQG